MQNQFCFLEKCVTVPIGDAKRIVLNCNFAVQINVAVVLELQF